MYTRTVYVYTKVTMYTRTYIYTKVAMYTRNVYVY